MSLKKPLVLGTDGFPQQLQASDTLDATISIADEITLTNGGASSAPIGTPVYISAASTFMVSRANASGTAKLIGLVSSSAIAAAATGSVRKDGTLTATTAQWDAVTGGTGGLTPGANYFVSATAAGNLTTTPPTSGWVILAGTAMSTTDLDIQVGVPYQL